MKIGVVFSGEDRQEGQRIVEFLKGSGARVRGYLFGAEDGSTESGSGELFPVSGSCDLPVFVIGSLSSLSKRMMFAAGFFCGRKSPCYIFLPDTGVRVPGELGSFTVVRTFPELLTLVEAEQRRWRERREVSRAKRELRDAELCLNRESLARCVAEGDIKAVRNFLKAGFSVNTRDRKGVPLLSIAVRNSHRVLVGLLLENNADVNAVSGDRENTALMDAASSGNTDILSDLVAHGADLNTRSRNGQTALILAIGNGALEAAIRLMQSGADTESADKLGMTARKYAELFRYQDVLSYLDSKGGKDG